MKFKERIQVEMMKGKCISFETEQGRNKLLTRKNYIPKIFVYVCQKSANMKMIKTGTGLNAGIYK